MSEYITLLGAEEISRAGRQMVSAAEEMRRAASQIDDTLRLFINNMEDWVLRLEALKEEE